MSQAYKDFQRPLFTHARETLGTGPTVGGETKVEFDGIKKSSLPHQVTRILSMFAFSSFRYKRCGVLVLMNL